MRRQVPARQPVGDVVQAAIVRLMQRHALVAQPAPGADVVARGTVVVRYGVRVLGKPFLSLVPGLVALDYGETLVGEEALRFLLSSSNLHPRADVVGYRNDGTDDMLPVKRLGVALPVMVLAYDDDAATTPRAVIEACLGDPSDDWPARMINALPHFPDFDAWRTALTTTPDATTDTSPHG